MGMCVFVHFDLGGKSPYWNCSPLGKLIKVNRLYSFCTSTFVFPYAVNALDIHTTYLDMETINVPVCDH